MDTGFSKASKFLRSIVFFSNIWKLLFPLQWGSCEADTSRIIYKYIYMYIYSNYHHQSTFHSLGSGVLTCEQERLHSKFSPVAIMLRHSENSNPDGKMSVLSLILDAFLGATPDSLQITQALFLAERFKSLKNQFKICYKYHLNKL